MTPLKLRDLRAKFLALEGRDLIEIHGWLLGVACAVERQRGADPGDADRLISELRASKGPPDWLKPVMCPSVIGPPGLAVAPLQTVAILLHQFRNRNRRR